MLLSSTHERLFWTILFFAARQDFDMTDLVLLQSSAFKFWSRPPGTSSSVIVQWRMKYCSGWFGCIFSVESSFLLFMILIHVVTRQVGDASGIQSPLSFGGFGSITRHLKRLTDGIIQYHSRTQLRSYFCAWKTFDEFLRSVNRITGQSFVLFLNFLFLVVWQLQDLKRLSKGISWTGNTYLFLIRTW
jgi:hypothetical protein